MKERVQIYAWLLWASCGNRKVKIIGIIFLVSYSELCKFYINIIVICILFILNFVSINFVRYISKR